MTTYKLSPKAIREIAETSGLAHAEMCLIDAASQIGSDKNQAAWNEFKRLEMEWLGDDPLGDFHGRNY